MLDAIEMYSSFSFVRIMLIYIETIFHSYDRQQQLQHYQKTGQKEGGSDGDGNKNNEI